VAAPLRLRCFAHRALGLVHVRGQSSDQANHRENRGEMRTRQGAQGAPAALDRHQPGSTIHLTPFSGEITLAYTILTSTESCSETVRGMRESARDGRARMRIPLASNVQRSPVMEKG